MNRSDIARMMYVGQLEIFKDTLKKNKKEEWPQYATVMNSTKKEETYDTLGNLQAAQEKAEESPVNYGGIKQAYQTTVTNKTYANGFKVTMEASEDDQYKVIDTVKGSELARTMVTKKEKEEATIWDGIFTNTGSDGVASASASHPLINSSLTNDNLASGAITPDNVIAASNKFHNIMNHAGDLFDTDATAILAHKDQQATVQAVLASNLKAMELSNTKNTVPALKAIFSRYINKTYWHLLDENIVSVILQKRKGLTTDYDYDKRDTFNFYFNAHERYRAAIIHPGFGHVSSLGV
jgi:phage major head subunit gpT-like protein